MERVVVDASVLAAIAFREDGADRFQRRLANASVHAPRILKHEMMQVAVNRIRKYPKHVAETLACLEAALDRRAGIHWHDVHILDVALLARSTGLSAYDASYMWLAGWLEAELLTLDKQLAAAVNLEAR